jgi:amino acid permease
LGLVIIALVFWYVVLDFIMAGSARAAENLAPHALRFDVMGHFQALALSTGAFQAHYNSPRIFSELGGDLRAHTCTVVNSFGAAFAVYASFAVAGIGLFGDEVLGNLLKNYQAEDNTMIMLAWCGMAFATIFTYPLIYTTGRDSLIGLVPSLQRAAKVSPSATHVAITSAPVAMIAGVACKVQDVSMVTGLLGATIGACLAWIFPACIYLKLTCGAPVRGNQIPLLQKPEVVTPAVKGDATLRSCAKSMVVVGTLSMCAGICRTIGAF